MSPAIASAGLADTEDAFRIVFHSIGTAAPGNAAAIALGLGVPVNTVLKAVYRAPSVLIDELPRDIGNQMQALLTDLGCNVSLDPMTAPVPAPSALFDVALNVTDTGQYAQMNRDLASFLGTTPGEAGRLISTPPGVVLGKVSTATIDALRSRLGDGVDLIASTPETALYDLFLGPCDATIRSRLLGDLRRRGMTLLGEDGCIVAGLTHAEAQAIWTSHQRVQALRVVNRDFLRFDLVMTGGALSQAASRALTEVAGIPAHVVPLLFDEPDITVMEAVPNAAMTNAMERLAASGLTIRADLVTFQHLGLEITAADRPGTVTAALRAIGIDATETDLCRLPYRLPYHMPELQARMVRDTLESSGARADLFDPTEEMRQ